MPHGCCHNCIELDITLRCNWACVNCNRLCNVSETGLDYSDTDMSIEQIQKFITQVQQMEKPFVNKLHITGGEPLLHGDIEAICHMLKEELCDKGWVKNKEIIIKSNGSVPVPRGIKQFDVKINGVSRKKQHVCFMVAPKDQGVQGRICSIPRHCGIGLSVFGYAPSGPCGTVARVFRKKEYLFHELSAISDPRLRWKNIERELCNYCGRGFQVPMPETTFGRPISLSWKQAMEENRKDPPVYGRF